MKKITLHLYMYFIFGILLFGFVCTSAIANGEACKWFAKVVSVQGSVQARKLGEKQWIAVKLNDIFCPGDTIRVQEQSRAALVLPNDGSGCSG